MASVALRAAGDLVITGSVSDYVLLRQLGSATEDLEETIEADEIVGLGCVVRTTTFTGNGANRTSSEALTYVPGCKIVDDTGGGFKLVPINLFQT